MTVADLLLNVKDTPLSTAICQTEIQTEDDKRSYLEKGYAAELTEEEFRKKFPELDPANIVYTPSIGCACLYFNRDTLAICPFHLSMLLSPLGAKYLDHTLETIELCEVAAAKGDFTSAITSLPDRMRLDFFTLLVQKFGAGVKDLYRQFFDAYCSSDYGFRDMDIGTLNVILQSKTEADRKRTAQAIADLPDEVVVYRGGNSKSTDYSRAYSWSTNINTANFFAARLGNGPGYIVKAIIRKSDIIEAFLGDCGNGEDEIIVDPTDLRDLEVTTLPGFDFLRSAIPGAAELYNEYKDKLHSLQFTHESQEHGVLHELRVLLLTQIIAEMRNLPEKDKRILAKAAIYHDTRRTHDEDDEVHGQAAGAYYWKNEREHNPVVSFLCEYHCLPDEEGYRQIRTNSVLGSYGKDRVKQLLQVFKDADALDRVRFGITELDWKQLRLDESKTLTLVARMNVEQVKQ